MIRAVLTVVLGLLGTGAITAVIVLAVSIVRAGPEFPPLPPGTAARDEEN
jgi:hypothetical protein